MLICPRCGGNKFLVVFPQRWEVNTEEKTTEPYEHPDEKEWDNYTKTKNLLEVLCLSDNCDFGTEGSNPIVSDIVHQWFMQTDL
jgi:hypothetical protein